MTLTNLIDLIAEVAAKRATREGGTKEETPNAVVRIIEQIRARMRHLSHGFSKIGFVFRKAVRQPHVSRRL